MSKDGSDSIATQIVPASHWPQMRILILVVNDARKKVGSTAGMQLSVETSPFLQYRADHIVEPRIKEIIKAIRTRDFETFGKITMQDSNQFHSVTWDTFPPCPYLNDVSQEIIRMVHGYNDHNGSTKVRRYFTYWLVPNWLIFHGWTKVLNFDYFHLTKSTPQDFLSTYLKNYHCCFSNLFSLYLFTVPRKLGQYWPTFRLSSTPLIQKNQ